MPDNIDSLYNYKNISTTGRSKPIYEQVKEVFDENFAKKYAKEAVIRENNESIDDQYIYPYVYDLGQLPEVTITPSKKDKKY